ncbi:MAG: hypothetical protein JHC54_15380, partial [Acinetobacter sp.]|nr:hypothetical protein [Acinetobacter sp.]
MIFEKLIKIVESNFENGAIDENIFESAINTLDIICKGGKKAFIGEIRKFGGREYIKTAQGWKFHGKGTGTKAQS